MFPCHKIRFPGCLHRLCSPAPAQQVEPALLLHGQFHPALAVDAFAQLALIGYRHIRQDEIVGATCTFAHLIEQGQSLP